MTVPDRQLLDASDHRFLKVAGYEIGSIVVKGYPPFIRGPDGVGIKIGQLLRDCNLREPEPLTLMVALGVPIIIFQDTQPLSTVDNNQPSLERVVDIMFDPCRADQFQRGLDECYFISSKGNVGLCPWSAKEGDVITLLHGATVPYLLRPVAKEGQATGQDPKCMNSLESASSKALWTEN